MNLEVVNKILDLAKQTNTYLEEMLRIQNELYEVANELTEEDQAELNSFVEKNEFLQAMTARNKEIFTALGWKVE